MAIEIGHKVGSHAVCGQEDPRQGKEPMQSPGRRAFGKPRVRNRRKGGWETTGFGRRAGE